ncbi:CRAL-TRIO domain-containing protein [Lipomyces arxii]|uniref:CRAL-TRIO domain-containing protein n=1 Tax=Lipomyces arxii TaxID=56418 RepID=UPI0034D012C8
MVLRGNRIFFCLNSARAVLRASPFLLVAYSDPLSVPTRLKEYHPSPVTAVVVNFPASEYFRSLYPPYDMPAEPAPGRPGNLTPEQEVKLKEFWVQVMKIFGVSAPQSLMDSGAVTAIISSTSTNGALPGKEHTGEKKKKRLGFLRKKDKKEDSEKSKDSKLSHTSSTLSSPTIGSDDNDKYGQSKQFKTAIAEMTPEELRIAFWSMVKADHPDGLLLRFLRARKWDVNKALVMMVSTMHWRLKECDVESVTFKGEGAAIAEHDDGFMKQIRLGKSYLHGYDKSGRPICAVRARLHKQGDQTEDALNRYTIYVIETARMCLKDPVDTATIVFDLSDFSLANMDYAPVKFMIKCFEAHYPESLGVCLVYKAPWIFQGIWNIIKGWLDPVVASKIHFAKNLDDLSEFIDRSKIWKELGGPLDWEYKYVEPVPGEDDLLKDAETREKLLEQRAKIVREYEDATWTWIYSSADETRQARHAIAKKLRIDYCGLDPYLRARTVYDRTDYIRLKDELQN